MSEWFERNRTWLRGALEVWAPREPRPLILRGWLSTEVAYDGHMPLTLEGALQCAVVLRETRQQPFDVFVDCPRDEPLENRDIQIPIVDVEAPDAPCPLALASHLQFSPDAVETKRAQRSRPRAENYQAKCVKTSEGQTKASNSVVATVTAAYVDIYVFGDAERLRVLLPDCCCLGKSHSAGIGSIHGWEIMPWETADAEGEILARRTVPFRPSHPGLQSGDADIRFATLRAPYWLQATRARCIVPVQRIGSAAE